MWKFIGDILTKFGLDTASILLVGWCFWKLFTNHLAHIAKAIDDNSIKIDNVQKDVNEVKKDVNDIRKDKTHLGERVATLEGQMKAPKEQEKK